MQTVITDHLDHLLAILIFIARLGDIGTTYLLSPKLKLEANPIIRKFRWPYAIATLLICLIPYVSEQGAVTILVASLMVSMSNSLRLWLVRTVGEEEYYQSVVDAAGRANPQQSIILLFLPGFFMSLLSFIIFMLYPEPDRDWGFWIAAGVFAYAMVLFIYMPASFLRFRKAALRMKQVNIDQWK
ncbi:MAG: hypothetical protein AMJ53_04015 [Gammaproteobacteria bacterium SG8_11]|nr:MAG: hypothetical protein AMJ53_04015 [Gammaproteobacteria bacterium SG8_11]